MDTSTNWTMAMVIKWEVGNGVDMGEKVANLEQYSMESPENYKDRKEVERVWYSAMDCWSSGIWHSVSGGVLLPQDQMLPRAHH